MEPISAADATYSTPWALRIFDRLPGNPLQIGICLVATLLLAFLAGRIFLELGPQSAPGDFRLAVIHILLAGYSVSAYVYLLKIARRVGHELAPAISQDRDLQALLGQVGRHVWWGVLPAGLAGMVFLIYATILTTTGSDPWDWRQNNYDSFWMRFLALFFGWYIGCSLYALVFESIRVSRLSAKIESIDLLNMEPYKPLVRLGLTNALVVLGMASICSLFLLEPGFGVIMIQALTLLAIFAWMGLMFPLTGIRKKIAIAKEQELKWCRQALMIERNKLKSGDATTNSLSEIVAYESMIEGIRNWPFDNPTLIRFAVYLLIPLGSLLGGAIVERGLELLIP
jgi:hypothetical protein